MLIFGKSVKGKRDYNQDRIFYDQKNACFFMAVADGVGGSSGGDIASGIITEVCGDIFNEFSENPSTSGLKESIGRIAEISTGRIRQKTEQNPEFSSMASTLTIVAGFGEYYAVGNIGDSRTYLVSPEGVRQLTDDHTYIREIENKYNPQIIESLREEMGHVITRSVSREESSIDLFPESDEHFSLNGGDILLLCSDGMIPEKAGDIEEVIGSVSRNSGGLEEAADSLIEWALAEGSSDNISIVMGKNEIPR
ncbi:MAG: hypothetical protein GF417_05030 [Candidatus Latescibacteria bacterium]|nr:hypothetical protein [bacterium]MBD3423782.1 hypothetical protein [Candidatus Latescibacterota bacterium]